MTGIRELIAMELRGWIPFFERDINNGRPFQALFGMMIVPLWLPVNLIVRRWFPAPGTTSEEIRKAEGQLDAALTDAMRCDGEARRVMLDEADRLITLRAHLYESARRLNPRPSKLN